MTYNPFTEKVVAGDLAASGSEARPSSSDALTQ